MMTSNNETADKWRDEMNTKQFTPEEYKAAVATLAENEWLKQHINAIEKINANLVDDILVLEDRLKSAEEALESFKCFKIDGVSVANNHFEKFVKSQEPLGAEFEAAWDDNTSRLYGETK